MGADLSNYVEVSPGNFVHRSKAPVAAKVAAGTDDEAALHDEIIEFCKSQRWPYFHGSMAHRAMRTVGEPDFTILAGAGRTFFVECKTKDGKLSNEQRGMILAAEMNGHKIHVVRSFEDFRAIVG